MGFLLLIAWRLLRPGLLPPWAGLPLGLFDDLYSGQPLGSGILLFSLALFAIEAIEFRFPWRSFWFDWLTAALLSLAYLAVAALLSGAHLTGVQLTVIAPQLLLSIVLFPVVARIVALLDRLRLMRVRRLG
jgi:rod shape-determining protein MreD